MGSKSSLTKSCQQSEEVQQAAARVGTHLFWGRTCLPCRRRQQQQQAVAREGTHLRFCRRQQQQQEEQQAAAAAAAAAKTAEIAAAFAATFACE